MEILKSFLREFHDMNEAILEGYVSLWKEYNIPKKQIMKVPGEIEKHLYLKKHYYENFNLAHHTFFGIYI